DQQADINIYTRDRARAVGAAGNFLYLAGGTISDCPVKIPVKDSNNSNYFDDDLNGFDEDGFITVFNIDGITSTQNLNPYKKELVNIYPNPADELLEYISAEKVVDEIGIYDLLGRQVSLVKTNSNSLKGSIDTHLLDNG